MSIAIDVDKVTHVLLADRWHEVAFRNDGVSTFGIDSYEYVQEDLEYAVHAGGQSGICPAGACWLDKEGRRISCPLTSVLAVMERKRGTTK